jgi:hypothetical protein
VDEVFESNEAAEIRRSPWALGVAVAAPVLMMAVAAVYLMRPAWIAAVPNAPVLAAGLLVLAFAGSRLVAPRIVPAPIRADHAGIRVGAHFVERAALRAGFVVPEQPGGHVTVVLRRRLRRSMEIRVGSAAEGRRLLHALGLDASQTLATFLVTAGELAAPRLAYGAVGGVCLLFLVFIAGLVTRVIQPVDEVIYGACALSVLGMLLCLVLYTMPTRLIVGADGLVLRWLGTARFIAYRDILGLSRHVSSQSGRQHIELAIALPSEEIRMLMSDESRLALIKERIEEAMDAYRRGDTESAEAALRRGARSNAAWIAALRAIGAGANAGPRTALMPEDRLWRIVEGPMVNPTARVAAAIALGAGGEGERRARLHAAAGATAAPRLRLAIENVAQGTDGAALENVLAEMEAEEASAAIAAR